MSRIIVVPTIYTQKKPLCRLCKIQNTFLIEFRVIPTAKVFKLVCYTFTLFTTEIKATGLTHRVPTPPSFLYT